MIDTKSTINSRKHTLLHYLTEVIERNFPDLVGFQTQLSHVEDASKVSIPSIRQALTLIRDGLREIKSLLENLEQDSAKSAEKKKGNAKSFLTTIGAFYSESFTSYEKIDAQFKKADQDYDLVVNLYGEDPKIMFPDEFFGIISQFSNGLLNAKIENETAIAKEKELEKRAAAEKVTLNNTRIAKKRNGASKRQHRKRQNQHTHLNRQIKIKVVWMT